MNMCDKSYTKRVGIKLLQITCLAATSFMVYKQFKLFVDNEDSSSVSYRKFNDKATDLYPTFSLCFDFGGPGNYFMYKDETILGNLLGLQKDRWLYHGYLSGTLEDNNLLENVSGLVKFEDALVPVANFLKDYSSFESRKTSFLSSVLSKHQFLPRERTRPHPLSDSEHCC